MDTYTAMCISSSLLDVSCFYNSSRVLRVEYYLLSTLTLGCLEIKHPLKMRAQPIHSGCGTMSGLMILGKSSFRSCADCWYFKSPPRDKAENTDYGNTYIKHWVWYTSYKLDQDKGVWWRLIYRGGKSSISNRQTLLLKPSVLGLADELSWQRSSINSEETDSKVGSFSSHTIHDRSRSFSVSAEWGRRRRKI